MAKYTTDILDKNLIITNNTYIICDDLFEDFDITKLNLDIVDNVHFDVLISLSVDNQNWLPFVEISNFTLPTIGINDFYIRLMLNQNFNYKTHNGFDVEMNVNDTICRIVINPELTYNSELITTRFKTIIDDVVITEDGWNFYDNQQTLVTQWLNQCIALSKIYGHTVIYFKSDITEDNEVYDTFSTIVSRDIVAIKKLLVLFPNNQLPQDRNVYSEWDFPLIDEFSMHVINSTFKQAFGEVTVPLVNDYIYLPILNKLYRVTSVQPKNGLMGVIGWWEVYLNKFETDETIDFSQEIKAALETNNPDDFDELQSIHDLNYMLDNTLMDADIVLEDTIETKKESNEAFTNKLIDGTNYVDLKETEAVRRSYNKRLQIISINPDKLAFPLTVYDCNTVDTREVAMTYDLKDLSSINKHNLTPTNSLQIDFSFILQKRFTGEVLDFVLDDGNILFSINNQSKKLFLGDVEIEYTFEPLEYYGITLLITNTDFGVVIYKLKNKIKTEDFRENYSLTESYLNSKIEKIFLYGGKYYIRDISFFIDKQKIFQDYVNPVLNKL